MIACLEIVYYQRGSGSSSCQRIEAPAWETVLAELRTMEPYEKPILSLMPRPRDVPDADVMMINGGNGVYHIQIADAESRWSEVSDPSGSDEIVDVWTSDQGFSTARKCTWSLEDANRIVRHYFETGSPHPEYHWS